MNSEIKSDAKLIESLGGPTKVAVLLAYPLSNGVQRVSNWRVRGIPARVRLLRPDIFGALTAPQSTQSQEAA